MALTISNFLVKSDAKASRETYLGLTVQSWCVYELQNSVNIYMLNKKTRWVQKVDQKQQLTHCILKCMIIIKLTTISVQWFRDLQTVQINDHERHSTWMTAHNHIPYDLVVITCTHIVHLQNLAHQRTVT